MFMKSKINKIINLKKKKFRIVKHKIMIPIQLQTIFYLINPKLVIINLSITHKITSKIFTMVNKFFKNMMTISLPYLKRIYLQLEKKRINSLNKMKLLIKFKST